MNASKQARKHLVRIVPLRAADEGWQDRAECATAEIGLMDATGGAAALKALALCRRCPVIDSCRNWVEQEPCFEGVAAGEVLKPRRRRSAAHGKSVA